MSIFTTNAYLGFEPSTELTQSSCNEGSSSFLGATAFMYSISNIFSCNNKPKIKIKLLVSKKKGN